MLTEVDDALRLLSAALLRREHTQQIVDQVQSLVEASQQAIEESRKLLAVNEALLRVMHRPFEMAPEPLTSGQLNDLADLIGKARGGYAFIWNGYRPFPVFDSDQSSAIH